ncbi:hypothetical protein V2J09_008934, partial [Rumex salicifolius]
ADLTLSGKAYLIYNVSNKVSRNFVYNLSNVVSALKSPQSGQDKIHRCGRVFRPHPVKVVAYCDSFGMSKSLRDLERRYEIAERESKIQFLERESVEVKSFVSSMLINTKILSTIYGGIGDGLSFLLPAGSRGGYAGGSLAVAVTAFAGLALVAAIWYTRRNQKSPWSLRKRKHVLSPPQWRSFFTPDGILHDEGVPLLKNVRSGGIDPSIRPEVWPFLLGVYGVKSSKEERDIVKNKLRRGYEKLRRKCRQLLEQTDGSLKAKEMSDADNGNLIPSSPASEEFLANENQSVESESSDNPLSILLDRTSSSTEVQSTAPSINCTDSSDSDISEVIQTPSMEHEDKNPDDAALKKDDVFRTEDFTNWKRIIRLDAVRANAEWIPYSPSQAAVSDKKACLTAEAVSLKDYEHLEPCRIFHAARLVAILEAYAVYDPEIGYCQGMSDLLSPIVAVIEEDYLAFWCFVGFMKKARHNFRLDEVGIREQLNTVSKIIKMKDSRLYNHLVNLQAEDCFFVYRMVVVLFRRELDFEQTLCLWEVMWADQAAIRAGVRKSSWRQRDPPPTDNLLLYAIAASVLQKRKQIIEKYSSMDEILRECNSMSGRLDVWKLLDDAHYLVRTLQDKIEI